MELVETKFNRTEFGEIPVDWVELNLGASSVLKARIGWQGLTTKEYLLSGEYYLITGTDFKDGYIDWDNCVYVEKLRYDQDKNIQIKVGDVLVTKDGTIGKIAFIDKVLKPTTLNSGVFVVRPIQNAYFSRYFYYVLMSDHFKEFLRKLTAGSTISHLYQKDFIHYNLPLPPTLQEQKAIATALSDVDNLIGELDALIEKKKAIKKGAMQQLLTGKTRVKGFEGSGNYIESEVGLIPEDWEVKELDQVLKFGSGQDYKHLSQGDIPVYGTGGVMTFVSGYLYDGDSVGIGRKGTIDKPVFLSGKFWTVDTLFYTYNFVDTTPKFIYYKFLMIKWKEYNEASGVPSLNKNTLGKIKATFPPTIDEQKVIAATLGDMDTEIKTLEVKRVKCQGIKQGMMQELLTGKTRLV